MPRALRVIAHSLISIPLTPFYFFPLFPGIGFDMLGVVVASWLFCWLYSPIGEGIEPLGAEGIFMGSLSCAGAFGISALKAGSFGSFGSDGACLLALS